jgi:hypothetical protein
MIRTMIRTNAPTPAAPAAILARVTGASKSKSLGSLTMTLSGNSVCTFLDLAILARSFFFLASSLSSRGSEPAARRGRGVSSRGRGPRGRVQGERGRSRPEGEAWEEGRTGRTERTGRTWRAKKETDEEREPREFWRVEGFEELEGLFEPGKIRKTKTPRREKNTGSAIRAAPQKVPGRMTLSPPGGFR